MIYYESKEQLANSLKLRLRIFNTKTGEKVPDIHTYPIPNTKEGLVRLKRDIDSLINKYDIIGQNKCSLRFYLSTRYKIELLSDFFN